MSTETWNGLEVHRFGDGPELADELLHLVLEGKKTATCWDAAEGLKLTCFRSTRGGFNVPPPSRESPTP